MALKWPFMCRWLHLLTVDIWAKRARLETGGHVCDVRTRAVCRSLLNGVLTLLHIDSQRAIFVESLSRRLHVPLVTSSAPPPQPISGHQAVISSTVLYIQPPLLAAAVADVIVQYGWRRVFYLYDSSEGKTLMVHLFMAHFTLNQNWL